MTNVGMQTASTILRSKGKVLMVLNCGYLCDPTVAIGVNITHSGILNSEYPAAHSELLSKRDEGKESQRQVCSVILRPMRFDSTLRSRLGTVSILAAVQKQHEFVRHIIVERYWGSAKGATSVRQLTDWTHYSKFLSQPRCTVWFRPSRPDQEYGFNDFFLDHSNPPAEQVHSSIIWNVDVQEPKGCPNQVFDLDIVASHLSGLRIALLISISWNTELSLHEPTLTAVATVGTGEQPGKPLSHVGGSWAPLSSLSWMIMRHVSLTSGVQVLATLHRQLLHGSIVFVVTLWRCESKGDLATIAEDFIFREISDCEFSY